MDYGNANSEDLNYIKEVVRLEVDVRVGFHRLLDYCERKWPHRVWRTLRGMQVEKDVEELGTWLTEVISSEPPPEEIKAFWFGLFNPIRGNGIASCGLYVSGSTSFDADENNSEWVCWSEDSYLPDGRYADSQALHEIYLVVSDEDVASVGEYVLCLGYAGLAIKELTKDWTRPVGVGFDSGDVILLR